MFRLEDTVRITAGEHKDWTGVVKIIDNVQRGTPPYVQSGILVKLDDLPRSEWYASSSLVVIEPRPE
jgi:hypothetical protein